MILVCSILILIYGLFNVFMCIKWIKSPIFKTAHLPEKLIKISVIIPVRNEAKNILELLESLDRQSINKNNFEIIIVNDASDDDTVKIIESFLNKSTLDIFILHLTEKQNNSSPKKRAITEALKIAKNELIVCTDGDCVVPPKWLESYIDFFVKYNLKLAFGAVTFKEKNNSFFEKIQILEFASLVGAGAASLMMKSPNMCNGANIAYLKSSFLELNGFEGSENLASGDDEFLMHKFYKNYPNEVKFIKTPENIVQTNAHDSLASFVQQRKRWASKWKHYEDKKIGLLAIFIFSVNLSTLLLLAVYVFEYNVLQTTLLLSLKFVSEGIFIYLIIKYLNKSKTLSSLPILMLIYPFYVCFFGLIAQKKGYNWKNRNLE